MSQGTTEEQQQHPPGTAEAPVDAPASAPTAPAPTAPAKASVLKHGAPLPATVFARLVLILAGLVWLGIGLWSLADPVALAEAVDFELRSDLARLEVRAMYGGFSIALGALHLLAAGRAVWLTPALVSTTVLTIGLLTGRILSIAIDGFPGVFALVLIGSEAALVAVAGLALWRLLRAGRAAAR